MKRLWSTIRYRRDPEAFYVGLLLIWLGGLIVGLSLGWLFVRMVVGWGD